MICTNEGNEHNRMNEIGRERLSQIVIEYNFKKPQISQP